MSAQKLSRLISILGPTASGKTSLAISLAEEFLTQGKKVSVISLDTRQIYRELPVLTMAEKKRWKKILQAYQHTFRLFYLETLTLKDSWSLGELLADLAQQKFSSTEVVLLLGGNALYHQRFLANNQFTQIPPNDNIRAAAQALTLKELTIWLQTVCPQVYQQLNQSERANHRRLTRHLEICLYQKIHLPLKTQPLFKVTKQEFIMPSFEIEQLKIKIKQRIIERFIPALKEVINVNKRYQAQLKQPFFTNKLPLGFWELLAYYQGEINREECLQKWYLQEWHYAKRQLTFLKKLAKIYDLVIMPT